MDALPSILLSILILIVSVGLIVLFCYSVSHSQSFVEFILSLLLILLCIGLIVLVVLLVLTIADVFYDGTFL